MDILLGVNTSSPSPATGLTSDERRATVIELRLNGWSQTKIAAATGYSQAAVSRTLAQYEADLLRASIPAARELSAAELNAAVRCLTAVRNVRGTEAQRRAVNAALAGLDAAPTG